MASALSPTAPTLEELLNLQREPHDEEIMMGLTETERQELMKEQRRIMAQIENETRATTLAISSAQADAFDQRSANAVAQVLLNEETTTCSVVNVGGERQHVVAIHGQEKTRAAIANGTAILANCIHCQTRVQVTHTATLMHCPVCAIVGPVETLSEEEEMDRRIAEQLQNELYADDDEEEEKQDSWWNSMTSVLTSSASANHVATENETEQTITFSNSSEERKGLLLNAGSARVAERQPLFSCVLDSVTSVADALTTLPQDEEGKVHGVDSSSLLAFESDTPYLSLGSATSVIET